MSSIWTVRRSATDHKVSGLSAGLARTWNVDPMLVRVGFAVLALSGGIGLVLYAAGWLMLPVEGKEQSQLEAWLPQTRTWSREVKTGVVVVACIIGAVALSWLVPFSFSAALVVAAVWFFGYYRHRQRGTQTEQQVRQLRFAEFPGEPTAFTEAAKAWQQRIAEYEQARDQERAREARPSFAAAPATSTAGTDHGQVPDLDHQAFLAHPDPIGLYSDPAPDSAIEQLAQEKRLRRRSARRLGLACLIVLGATMAGLGVASVTGAAITTAVYLSAALLIFGITLLAGARFGRPRGLAAATVIVAIAMILTLLAQGNTAVAGDVGIRRLQYTSAEMLPASDHLRVGQLKVDLQDISAPDRPRSYSASVDTGRLIVQLPSDVPVELTGTVGDGMITTRDRQATGSGNTSNNRVRSGPNLSIRESIPGAVDGPVLTVHLHVGNGQLEVRR
ncbi:MAG: PspC domain-containing protein [Microlunatus sp.]|nr:PspC domain-containing protein [Microlunatus sp.]